MKNNKGFTLIELLITIVMMLSLTILVVVGFTKVSDSKKEEADKLTVNQIETAAEQYFSTNYYWIEYLKKGNAADYIHVNLAQLIKDDYLNVVSSVSTEKKYSKCDIVKVTYDKNANKLNFKYDNETYKDETYCNPKIELAGPLKISYEIVSGTIKLKADSKNLITKQWYASDINLKVKVSANTYDKDFDKDDAIDGAYVDNKDFIKNVTISVNGKNISNDNYAEKEKKVYEKNVILSAEGENEVVINAKNYAGGEYPAEVSYYKDSVAPTSNITSYITDSDKTGFTNPKDIDKSKLLNNNAWTKEKIYSVSIGQDNNSGIYKSGSYCTYDKDIEGIIYGDSGTTFEKNKYGIFLRYTKDAVDTISCVFSDNAGNISNPVSFNIKRDNTKPSLTLSSFKSKDLSKIENHTATSSYTSGDWYSGYVDVIAVAKDDLGKVTLRYERTNDGNGGSIPRDMSKQSSTGAETTYKTYSKAEGTSYYTFTATDEAGNTKSLSYTVKLDRTDPTCIVKASGTKGNVVDDYQWFITDNVEVTLDKSSDQEHRSGIDSSTYGLSQKTTINYNSKKSVTESDEGLTTWYCYVKDNAGNEGHGNYTFGLEKSVNISFNAALTNLGTSEGENYGELVFNADKNGPCGYGTCSNIKCRTNGNSEYCATGRFARACRYVKSYPRFFTVTAASEYTTPTLTYAEDSEKESVKISGTTYYRNDRIVRLVDHKRDEATDEFSSNYDYRYVGDEHGSGTNDFSAHKYQYTSPAGLKSNGVRLYTEYGTECY